MNNGRLWCVVSPTVGLPLFLGGVITVSLVVHASVMTNTTWMGNFWQGSAARAPARAEAAPPNANLANLGDSGFSVSVTPVVAGPAGSAPTAFVITVVPRTDGAQPVTLVQNAEAVPGGSGVIR